MEILKDIIWPVTVIIVTLIFYKPISKLIESITALRRKGVEIDFGKASQQKQLVEPDLKLEVEFDPTVTSDTEKRVETDLNLNSIEGTDEKIRRLKKYATIKEITINYLNLYIIIYGSQIKLLQYLNLRRGVGETKENLQKIFYDPASSLFPEFYKSNTFEDYFAFLVAWSMIVPVTGDKYGITIYGKDFLSYLTRQGLTYDKQY
jgi:hypothetical protein